MLKTSGTFQLVATVIKMLNPMIKRMNKFILVTLYCMIFIINVFSHSAYSLELYVELKSEKRCKVEESYDRWANGTFCMRKRPFLNVPWHRDPATPARAEEPCHTCPSRGTPASPARAEGPCLPCPSRGTMPHLPDERDPASPARAEDPASPARGEGPCLPYLRIEAR